MFDPRRIRTVSHGKRTEGPVIYLMTRDYRAEDNWALLYAQKTAKESKQALLVAVPVAADYPDASDRQVSFLTAGLIDTHEKLNALGIPMLVNEEPSVENVTALARETAAGTLICDFNPLRESQAWKSELAARVSIPILEVDAHNIVPVWEASDKLEYAAYTIRPKINRKLNDFLTPLPRLTRHPFPCDLTRLPRGWSTHPPAADHTKLPTQTAFADSGERAARKILKNFLSKRLEKYGKDRNDPTKQAQSGLSVYLHFGQISAQRVALEAQRFDRDVASQEAFLEELIVRRELSDNFCFYNPSYDSFKGFPSWAQQTLKDHRSDPRPYLYDVDSLEGADTHDGLWNAAQTQMVTTGKMHGYLRMYWAKKILEWTTSPEEAITRAIYLNNKYELDGHDPNGYVGVAWSIGGVHDRAWFERDVFGKVRYMSLSGCRRKFNVEQYIRSVRSGETGSDS